MIMITKRFFTIFIFILLFLSVIKYSNAQKVFSVNYKGDADIKVYVVDYKGDADLVVYKCKYKGDASGNKGLWHFVDYKGDADKKIYFVDYKGDADLKIYFADYKGDAGWRNDSKKHLIY